MYPIVAASFFMLAAVRAQEADDSIYENKDDIKLAASCFMKKNQTHYINLAYVLVFEYSDYLNVTAQFIPFYNNKASNFTLFVHQNADTGTLCENLGPPLEIKEGSEPVGKLGELKWEVGRFGLPKIASLRFPDLKISGQNGVLNHTFALYEDPPTSEGEQPAACCALRDTITPDQL